MTEAELVSKLEEKFGADSWTEAETELVRSHVDALIAGAFAAAAQHLKERARNLHRMASEEENIRTEMNNSAARFEESANHVRSLTPDSARLVLAEEVLKGRIEELQSLLSCAPDGVWRELAEEFDIRNVILVRKAALERQLADAIKDRLCLQRPDRSE